jgi:hypothetical protein
MTAKYGPNLGLLEGAALGEGHFADLKKFLRGVDGLAQLQVLDKDLATPPGSPADGDRYIVAASPTGAWSGKAGQVARWTTDGSAWEFYPPKSGWNATCADEPGVLYQHNGTAWIGTSLAPLTSGMIDVLQRNAQGTTIIDMGGNDYYMTEEESQHQAIFLLNTGTGKTCYLYDSVLNPALITIVIYSATGVDFSCCAGGVVIAAAPLATYQLAYTYTTAVELDYARRDSATGQLIDPIDASNITTGTINSARIPTLNQNTTGSAATLTTARTIDGQSFNGSANIAVIAPGTNAATSKATPVDADEIPLVDSAASNVLKKLTWANLKATLKTYFDTLYGCQVYTFASGLYYTVLSSPSDGATAFTQNNIFGTYFPVSVTTTFDRIGIEVTAAIASSTVRLGIFRCVGGVPTTRVLDAGTIDSSTTGAKEITISQSLTPGLYILVACPQGGASSPTLRSRTGGYGIPPPQTSIANQNNTGFNISGVSGAFASSYSFGISQTSSPKVYLRAA